MEAVNVLSLNTQKRGYRGEAVVGRIEIDLGRVATWTLIFTNTFFVTYFFAKLFQLI